MSDTARHLCYSVLLIPMYDENWASSRYRVYNYLPYLRAQGVQSKVVYPPSRKPFERIGYLVSILYYARQMDIVFIQKKIFKKSFLFLLHKLNPQIVYDMDDAMFAKPTSVPSSEFMKDQICRSLNYLLQKSRIVITGNNFLNQYVLQFNPEAHIIPTPILNKGSAEVPHRALDRLTIGWIGNHENLIYLDKLAGVIQTLNRKFKNQLIFKVICNELFKLKGVDIQNVKWSISNIFIVSC